MKALSKAVDIAAETLPKNKYIFQISNGIYKPSNGSYFSFTNNFSDYIDEADVIITHAGAGTVFELLEKQKKCIVVPNYERVDKHQSDLSTYIEKNKLAIVCHKLENISSSIQQLKTFEANPYIKEPFFLIDELIDIFK
ncbi:PssE/Cps14G family polysaccharide biosynthesis glycosyltransferase [Pseudoalteromonas sp. B137]